MEKVARVHVVLVRHCFQRFFDRESLSPQGDPQASLAQLLGLLAVPGAFFVLLLRPLTLVGWDLVYFRYFFLQFSMIVMALVVVLRWESLFPDRRDYEVLAPLPIRWSSLFLAKIATLGALLGIFLIDINFFTVLFWPGIDGKSDVLAILVAHATALVAAGLFAALAVASVQGILVTLLSGNLLRRVSVLLQMLLIAALVMLFFLTSLLASSLRMLVEQHSLWLYAFPGYWFIGLYERLRPATHNSQLAALGTTAVQALGCAAAVFILTYIPGYLRQTRKVLETPQPSLAGPGPFRRAGSRILDRLVLRSPVERAVFHFIGQTITRSMKHRLFLAAYGGFGLALAVLNLSNQPEFIGLPFTLSFTLLSGLRAAFNFPSELAANWAFRINEICPVREYTAAIRKWVFVCAILPLYALLAPLEFVSFGWTVGLFHLAFGIALASLLAAVLFAGFHKVPFTCSYFPGKVNLVGLSVIYVLGFTTYSAWMAQFETRLTRMPVAATASVIALSIAGWGVGRYRRPNPRLDFEDLGDPEVRTLGLASR